MRFWHLLFCIGFSLCAYSQNDTVSSVVNDRYFEDQFYLGITYNFVRNTPDDFQQRNLSYGLQAGVIKDIPLNKSGTRALGLGLGLALNTYYTNLVVREAFNGFSYALDDGTINFKKSKLETHLLEVPFEYRWRNSTPEEYRFWRLYVGVKAAYVIGARSKLVTTEYKDGFYNTDVNNFQYGLTFNLGYNTFNVHLYYALSDFFGSNVVLDDVDVPIAIKPLRVGFIFYIL